MSMSATKTEAEQETGMPKPPKLTGVEAALADVDQHHADLQATEQAAAEAAADATSLHAQTAALEDRIRGGDPEAAPTQIIELQGLSRFADLQSEAAQTRVEQAKRRLFLANARLFAARWRDYEATEESEMRRTFWDAVTTLARLGDLMNERRSVIGRLSTERSQLYAAVADIGDAKTLADLATCTPFETSIFDTDLVGLAFREAFPGDRGWRLLHAAVRLPHQMGIAEFPALAAARPQVDPTTTGETDE